jgi:hypothetical protein
MSKLIFTLVLGLFACTGCTHQYVMKLTNGHEITTASKPKLKGASYHFKDAKGQDNVIPQGRVLQIEPASMAREEEKPYKPAKPKQPKHWYFLWLA